MCKCVHKMCVHMCMCMIYAVHDVYMHVKSWKEGNELCSEVTRMYDQNMNLNLC
jgi:hypothetical protein